MISNLLETLSHSNPTEARSRLGLSARDLDARVLQLTASLNGQCDAPACELLFAYVAARSRESSVEAQRSSQPLLFTPELVELREWVRSRCLPMTRQITPELLEWARREFDKYSEAEIRAAVGEIETTGDLHLKNIVHELDQEVATTE